MFFDHMTEDCLFISGRHREDTSACEFYEKYHGLPRLRKKDFPPMPHVKPPKVGTWDLEEKDFEVLNRLK